MQEFSMSQNVIQVSIDPNIETCVYILVRLLIQTLQSMPVTPMNSLIIANRSPRFGQFGALMYIILVSIDKNTKIIKNITFCSNYCVTKLNREPQ